MDTLGEYIDLSREKLKMAVWDGKIEFKNLNLKLKAFNSLDLPVHLRYYYCVVYCVILLLL